MSLAACSSEVIETPDVVESTNLAAPMPQAGNQQGVGAESAAAVETEAAPAITVTPISVEYDKDDLETPSANDSDTTAVVLAGDTITLDGDGATVDGRVVTITSAGTYRISGALDDGQILVDTEDEEKVVLILGGVDIYSSTSAPIYISNAEKVVITLEDGTENVLTDGDSYVYTDADADEPNATLFSNDDLTINGNGSLTVNANYNNGIVSDDDLKITGGRITVHAVNDGVKGKDSLAVKDGVITVVAGSDGLQSHNDQDTEKGYVSIEGGTLNVTAGLDGIQAETSIAISGGDITITSGGGSVNGVNQGGQGGWGMQFNPNDTEDTTESTKGLKAGVDVTISGGSLTIDSADDSIHSNSSLTINDGEMILTSGDDGIHSDATLVINGGTLEITKSYEGIESALITINGGTLHVVSSDDGINVAGGNDGSAMGGRPGQNNFADFGSYLLEINGGYIYIDAGGDGLDSNGSITMSAGTVLVNGPTNSGNGALDYMGTFELTGGFMVAAGSAGMAEAPSTSSSQYSLALVFQSEQQAGTLIHIETQDGQEVLAFAPSKVYQSVVFSSPELENGVTYVVSTGGSSSGVPADGLYTNGSYTGGSEYTSMTISSIVTGVGSFSGGFGGGGRRRQ